MPGNLRYTKQKAQLTTVKKNSRKQFTRKHTNKLRSEILGLLERSNVYMLPERKIAAATAITVANRDLRKTRNSDPEARIFSALRAVSGFISLAANNKVTTAALANADLLPVGHPHSAKPHAMTASALRHARAQWIAADPFIDDSMRALVATAHSAIPGSIEREHAFIRLAIAGPRLVPLTAAIDMSTQTSALSEFVLGFGLGGNSKAARSARAQMQRRDRYGKFAEMGGGFSFNIRMPDGLFKTISGRTVGATGTEDIEIEVIGAESLPDGIYTMPSNKGTAVKAILSEEAVKGVKMENVSTKGNDVFVDFDTVSATRKDAPSGWRKNSFGEFVSEDEYLVSQDGNKNYTLLRALDSTQVGDAVTSWADIQKLALSDQDDYEKALEKFERETPQIPFGARKPATGGKKPSKWYKTGKGSWKEWDEGEDLEPSYSGKFKPAKARTPEKAPGAEKPTGDVYLDPAGDVAKQIADAIDNGQSVKFSYSGKERTVEPKRVWTNPKNGNVNLEGVDATDGSKKNFTVNKIEKSSKAPTPEAGNYAEIDFSKDVASQLRNAIQDGQKVKFTYSDKQRDVTPTRVWTNPKNGNVNLTAVDADGVEKNYTVDKISPAGPGEPPTGGPGAPPSGEGPGRATPPIRNLVQARKFDDLPVYAREAFATYVLNPTDYLNGESELELNKAINDFISSPKSDLRFSPDSSGEYAETRLIDESMNEDARSISKAEELANVAKLFDASPAVREQFKKTLSYALLNFDEMGDDANQELYDLLAPSRNGTTDLKPLTDSDRGLLREITGSPEGAIETRRPGVEQPPMTPEQEADLRRTRETNARFRELMGDPEFKKFYQEKFGKDSTASDVLKALDERDGRTGLDFDGAENVVDSLYNEDLIDLEMRDELMGRLSDIMQEEDRQVGWRDIGDYINELYKDEAMDRDAASAALDRAYDLAGGGPGEPPAPGEPPTGGPGGPGGPGGEVVSKLEKARDLATEMEDSGKYSKKTANEILKLIDEASAEFDDFLVANNAESMGNGESSLKDLRESIEDVIDRKDVDLLPSFDDTIDDVGYDLEVFGPEEGGPGEPPAPGEPPTGGRGGLQERSGDENAAKDFISTLMYSADQIVNEGAKPSDVPFGDLFEVSNGIPDLKMNTPLFTLDDGREITYEENPDGYGADFVLRDKNGVELARVDASEDMPEKYIFRGGLEPGEPTPAPEGGMESYLEAEFDSMYDTPDGSYKPNIFELYTPVGRTTEESEDFTDDPSVLSQMFSKEELAVALAESVLPGEDGTPANGYGNLRFDAGDESIKAEAIYEALGLQGDDMPDRILAAIYDSGLEPGRAGENIRRFQQRESDMDLLDRMDEAKVPLIPRDKEVLSAIDRNGALGTPSRTQNTVDLMRNYKETNAKIFDLADDLKSLQDEDIFGDGENLRPMLDKYLPWAYSQDPRERQAFRGLWGMMMSLDGGSSLESEYSLSGFRGTLFGAIGEFYGLDDIDDIKDRYDSFVDDFGGFPEFVDGKTRIADGDDDLDSGSVAADFFRLMKASSRPNEDTLYRVVNVKAADAELLDQYTTEGSVVGFDPRPFSTNGSTGGDFLDSMVWASSDLSDHRIVFVAPPRSVDSIDATSVSWFPGEGEHIGNGQFEIVSVRRQKSGDPRRADEFIVEIGRTDKTPDDLTTEQITEAGGGEEPPLEVFDTSGWLKTGGQAGSNPGGFYEDENGVGYYVKVPKSQSHADNEILASVFYEELGIPAATVRQGEDNGDLRIVSVLIPGAKPDLADKVYEGDQAYLDKLRDGFAVDAWLSNYDVTGTGWDNVVTDENGDPVRVDPGGALMWRAQGKPKLGMFGDTVGEIDSLRDEDINEYAAAVFGSMTDEDVKKSARHLLNITPSRIDELVDKVVSSPEDRELLKSRLKKRRQDILDRFDMNGPESDDVMGAPVSLANSIGFAAQDLKPGDVTVGDSFVVERVFRDDKTPKGKVSVEGYFPGHQTQRKEWNENTVISAARGGTTPPKGDNPPLHRPKRPYEPTPPAFLGAAADEIRGLDSWEAVRDAFRGRDIVFFDYETTGFPDSDTGEINTNKPVQLGAVKVRDGVVVDRFNMFMDPMENLGTWSRNNLKDADGNPLTDEYLAQQVGMGEAHALFTEWAGPDAIFGAHNTPFDRGVFETAIADGNIDYTPAGYIDTLRLSRDLIQKRSNANPDNPERHTLGALSEYYGIDMGSWHTADADAQTSAMLFNAILDDALDNEYMAGKLPNVDRDAADYDRKKQEFDAAVESYKDALADYNARKAVAAAWNCNGGGITAAVGDNNNCNVPSVDDLIDQSTVTPGSLSDPEGFSSGDPSNPSNPVDDAVEVVDKYPVDGEAYSPTPQQQAIIDTFLENPGSDIVVRAAAGAGKTSTLLALARRIQKYDKDKRIIYIAFNRSVADEARQKMPGNVEVRTADAIAYNWVRQSREKLFGKFGNTDRLVSNKDIAEYLGVPSVTVTDPRTGEKKTLKPMQAVSLARKAIYNFTISSDDQLDRKHFDLDPDEVPFQLLDAAKRWWDDVTSPEGKLTFAHNHMKKLWALSNPDLSSTSSGLGQGADIIFVDEFQDTNDVLGAVVSNQPNTQNVYVGDENQAIYQFMGANDWLQKVSAEHDLPLTQSFRFGENIAREANKFLRFKERYLGGKKTFSVEGAGKNPGTVVQRGTLDRADAVLVRSNVGAFKEIRTELQNGRTVGVTKGFKRDLDDFITGVEWLKGDSATRGNRPTKMTEELRQFNIWQELVDEAAKEDSELGRKTQILVSDVEELGLDELKDMASRVKLVKGAGDKKDVESMPDLGDNFAAGVSGELGKDVNFKALPDGVVLSGATFGVKDQIKASNKGVKWDKERGGWFIPAKSDADRKNALLNVQNKIFSPSEREGGKVDVVVTTVHQAKGLEWKNVRIGNDFRGPRQDKDTGEWIYPSEPEIHLAYVAVTRAEETLDPGALDWINDFIGNDEPELDAYDPTVVPNVAEPDSDAIAEADASFDAPEMPTPAPGGDEEDTIEDIVNTIDIGEATRGDAEDANLKPGDIDRHGNVVTSPEMIAETVKDFYDILDEIHETMTGPDSNEKVSMKKTITDAYDRAKEVRANYESGNISKEEAVDQINQILDDLPEPEWSDKYRNLYEFRDMLSEVRDTISGKNYERATSENLPPPNKGLGYSKNGVFINIGARVRDKWGFLGTVHRYNKLDKSTPWTGVYVRRDIDGKELQKGVKHLTTVGDNDNQSPWVLTNITLSDDKYPKGWRDMVTPEQAAEVDAFRAKKGKKGKAAESESELDAEGKPKAGTTTAFRQNMEEKAQENEADGEQGPEEEPGDGGGGPGEPDLPKGDAPSGASQAPEENTAAPDAEELAQTSPDVIGPDDVVSVEEGAVPTADIQEDWLFVEKSSPSGVLDELEKAYSSARFTSIYDEKADSLLSYQEDFYNEINAILRGTDYGKDLIEKAEKGGQSDILYVREAYAAVSDIDEIIDNAPTLDRTLLLFRGVHGPYSTELLDGLEVGDLFTDEGYPSTSLSASVGIDFAGDPYYDKDEKNVLLEIVAPPGTKYVSMNSYLGIRSNLPNEKELLLQRGTTFRVISKIESDDDELIAIRVAVVHQEPKSIKDDTPKLKTNMQDFRVTDTGTWPEWLQLDKDGKHKKELTDASEIDEAIGLVKFLIEEGEYYDAGKVYSVLYEMTKGVNFDPVEYMNESIDYSSYALDYQKNEAKKRITGLFSAGLSERQPSAPLNVLPTGRPPVTTVKDKSFIQSNFEGVPSLIGAVKKVINKENPTEIVKSSIVDSGDIEDLEVKAMTIVTPDGERKLRLKFKLTAWAGRDKAVDIEELMETGNRTWKKDGYVNIKASKLTDDGDIEVDTAWFTVYSPQQGAVAYSATVPLFNTETKADISIIRAVDNATAIETPGFVKYKATKEDHAPLALHNSVTIDLPLDATEDDIQRALQAAGVRSARPATTEDVNVFLENRLISIFSGYTDAAVNITDPDDRKRQLDKIKNDWGVTVDDIEVRVGPTGMIEYKLPENVAAKIADARKIDFFVHSMDLSALLLGSDLAKIDSNFTFRSGLLPPDEEYNKKIEQERVRRILNILDGVDGAGLRSTVNRLEEGHYATGMSSSDDISSGGADYVYFKAAETPYAMYDKYMAWEEAGASLIYPAETLLQRSDVYANEKDEFGHRDKKKSDGVYGAIDQSTYEVMFKDRVGIDGAVAIVVGVNTRDALVKSLKERGVDQINGIDVEDFVIVGGSGIPLRLKKVVDESEVSIVETQRLKLITDIEDTMASKGYSGADAQSLFMAVEAMTDGEMRFTPAPVGSKVLAIGADDGLSDFNYKKQVKYVVKYPNGQVYVHEMTPSSEKPKQPFAMTAALLYTFDDILKLGSPNTWAGAVGKDHSEARLQEIASEVDELITDLSSLKGTEKQQAILSLLGYLKGNIPNDMKIAIVTAIADARQTKFVTKVLSDPSTHPLMPKKPKLKVPQP